MRYVAPFAFLILMVSLVTVILESGIMNSSSTSPSASPSASGSPAVAFTLYKVRKGDTLSGIATKKHTTITAIISLNPGIDQNTLSVGQKIKIPKAAR